MDDFFPDGHLVASVSNLRPAQGQRCHARLYHDIQSGYGYCGESAVVVADSVDIYGAAGSIAYCERHQARMKAGE